MADEVPGRLTGDVIFIIQEKEHDLFKRKGADLLIMQDISLNQALTGFSLRFNHLDGRDIIIKTKPGQVIQSEAKDPDSGRSMPYMMMVSNEGMPSRGKVERYTYPSPINQIRSQRRQQYLICCFTQNLCSSLFMIFNLIFITLKFF